MQRTANDEEVHDRRLKPREVLFSRPRARYSVIGMYHALRVLWLMSQAAAQFNYVFAKRETLCVTKKPRALTD